jgi:hypothetical protein
MHHISQLSLSLLELGGQSCSTFLDDGGFHLMAFWCILLFDHHIISYGPQGAMT